MDTNGHELIRIKPGKGLTQGEALQFRIFVGPDLVSGRSGVGRHRRDGLTQGEALQFRIGVGPDLVSGRSGLRGRAPERETASRKVRPYN